MCNEEEYRGVKGSGVVEVDKDTRLGAGFDLLTLIMCVHTYLQFRQSNWLYMFTYIEQASEVMDNE